MPQPNQNWSENTYRESLRVQDSQTSTRTVGFVVSIAILCVASVSTYGCHKSHENDINETQRAVAEAQLEHQTRINCLGRGGNWIPVQAVHTEYDREKAVSRMSCVSDRSMPAVQANNKLIAER